MTQKFIDRDGLKVLWNQVNLKDYPNNETLMAVIDAIDETKADKDELFSKSWNDLTDRPFYEETTISENIIINTEHDFTTGGLYINNLATVANEVVKITVNENEEYTATVFYVGNPIYEYSLRNFSEGCPFEYDFEHGLIDTTGTLGNVNIKITNQSTATTIKKIDEKYLPQLIGKATDEGGEIFNYYLHESINENFAGYYSHAEGFNTKAKGKYSHAEGCNTTASSDYSHVEGNDTTAEGKYSHAEGYYTKASGTGSHAEGQGTVASSQYQHVQGKFNIEDTQHKYAHIIGNGVKHTDGSGGSSNAHTVDWDGNAWYAGDVFVGGTGQDDVNAKKLATEEYVDTSVANLVNSAPETMDTLGELATAMQENQNVVDTLNQAITNKADKSALDSKLDANKYVVDSELSNSSTNPVQNKVVKEYVDSKVVQSWNDLEDKPFGEYAEELEIADKEIPFTSNSYTYYSGSLLSEPVNKISVYWNGIKYECESIFIDGIRYGYGNCRLYGDYYDSGEPFALIFDTTNGNTKVIKNNNETETVSCKIASYEEGIKLIDDKYISYRLVRDYDVLKAANQNSSNIDYSPRNPHNLATKKYVDDLELITIEDINTICGTSIKKSKGVLL